MAWHISTDEKNKNDDDVEVKNRKRKYNDEVGGCNGFENDNKNTKKVNEVVEIDYALYMVIRLGSVVVRVAVERG